MKQTVLEQKMVIVAELGDTTVQLPFIWVVCPDCEGSGKSSAYLGDFTGSEWADLDVESRENYLAGHYDKPCYTCKGKRVVPKIDRDKADLEALEAWDDWSYEEHMAQLQEAAELRAGC